MAWDPDEDTLETVLLRLQEKHGFCLFEFETPPDSGTRWGISGFDTERHSALGRTLLEAAQRLETKLTVKHREAD